MSGTPPRLNEPPSDAALHARAEWLRRPLYFALVAVTVVFGIGLMLDILHSNQLRLIEIIILPLFAISFGWIAFSFWSAAIGFVLNLLRIDPLTLRSVDTSAIPASSISTRTAVLMPVYNEETPRVIAGFEATLRSIIEAGALSHFDFYLLSDSTDAEVAKAEALHWNALVERLGEAATQVFYRRREDNHGRKVGNIADFCQRWGDGYDFMITLDADSVMSADCLLQLVRHMQASPRAGMIQTVPIPVRQTTFFGRFLQYAAALYSPMLATGLSFWQTDCANYWGHNAIVRMRAFINHCGMPTLPGKAPLGGEILSHDFVEAALLRRAGWQCFLLPQLKGSYEEVPGNILDYAKRDRRWVQGNLQHAMLLQSPGLHPLNRLHFVLGILAYTSSLLWLLMLALSTIDAGARALSDGAYFTQTYQLFPDWPVARSGMIFSLIGITIALLLLPKLMGVLLAMKQRRDAYGGSPRIALSAGLETMFAILIAPLMMVFHTGFVTSVLLGRQVSWDTQSREGRLLGWRDVLTRTAFTAFVSVIWGSLTYRLAPAFFWWLMPVLVGLTLSAPLVRYSSSPALGQLTRRLGIFLTPDELDEDEVLVRMRQLLADMPDLKAHPDVEPPLPPPPRRLSKMPIQTL
jgi:membrane glycosyltransferase